MSDALGGVVNLALVVFFIVVIALYMAFNVNYSKAFNVKNEIINIYEKYDGYCKDACQKEIENYEKKLGYPKKINEIKGYKCHKGLGFCIKGVDSRVKPTEDGTVIDTYDTAYPYCYFEIVTQVDIEIPVINNLMGLRLFQVTGKTKSMKIESYKSCNNLQEMAFTSD